MLARLLGIVSGKADVQLDGEKIMRSATASSSVRSHISLAKAAEVFAARGIGADMGQLGVFSRHTTSEVATVGLSDRLLLLALHLHLPSESRANGRSPAPLRRGLTGPTETYEALC
jgi:hypothetical protein